MGKGLTITVVFEAGSLNYGEGVGNISELKKVNRGNGQTYTFASRQCLGFDIRRLGAELFDWKMDTVTKNGTIQYKKDITIEDSEEMDLFGYMKTASRSNATTRSAAVRLSPAFSMEPYKSDMDFLNNKGLADRIDENPNLANIEQHQSFYTYTMTVDLNRVGKDADIELDNTEKAKRLRELLTIVKLLNRNIRGRQETLSPVFVVGGVYDLANPFFQGRIKLGIRKNNYVINVEPLNDALEIGILDNHVKDNTLIGIIDGIFTNKDEIEKILGDKVLSVENFFKKLELQVAEVYK
ncbi:type I-B CRISPR-associated protein Cas7/Cst2/DevR [Iocasia frigidifontis]|uniref:Type I-B CRISPR-associated protein Cas7/Cst2/DevR n=1 Tax=Iocasia fonsfrigidae TaxID=2682810 RepID=A0A8A7KHA8_9FIRM|nr:type I-B CRISPR-associated protein Cas7/Cst2/DevR [Iocasia fonsfrigidae]QTL99148.1 type I-B CRISPR-associated protein Cas7/Cst2/DevR [Iocasia fonsfrigidae]